MLSVQFIQNIARSATRLSEDIALEHNEVEFSRPAAPAVPLLNRKPLEQDSAETLEVLHGAAGNPYRYEADEPGRLFARPLVLDRSTTVGHAIGCMRDRLTYLTALLQAFEVPMSQRRGPDGNLRDAAVDLIHEAASFLAVVEIGAFEEHHRQVRNALSAA